MAKKRELDMFKELLPALDRRNYKFYSTLTDIQKKEFSIVAMRYMSTVSDKNLDMCKYHIEMVNDGANKHFWNSEISKHPELQYLTLASCGVGKTQRHEWIKGPISKNKQTKVYAMLREYNPTASMEEFEMLFNMNDINGLIEIAKILGYQDDQIKIIKKEIKGMKK